MSQKALNKLHEVNLMGRSLPKPEDILDFPTGDDVEYYLEAKNKLIEYHRRAKTAYDRYAVRMATKAISEGENVL